MTTVTDICSRALSRLRIIAAGETMSAEDGLLAVTLLNDMIHGWKAGNVDVKWTDAALTDVFRFVVPPADATYDVIDALASQGTWNAATNTPALVTGAGTKGFYYRVSVAGTTTLDAVTSWAVDEYAVFNGTTWAKGPSSRRFERAVIDLLALHVSPDFGKAAAPVLAQSAMSGWRSLQAPYLVPRTENFDTAIVRLPSRRYPYSGAYSINNG